MATSAELLFLKDIGMCREELRKESQAVPTWALLKPQPPALCSEHQDRTRLIPASASLLLREETLFSHLWTQPTVLRIQPHLRQKTIFIVLKYVPSLQKQYVVIIKKIHDMQTSKQ